MPIQTQFPATYFKGYVRYFFRDTFNSGSWPTGGGTRTSDIGQLTVVDSGSHTSMSDGAAKYASVVNFADPAFSTTTFSRSVGLCLTVGGYLAVNRSQNGWRDSGNTTDQVGAEVDNIAAGTVGGEATASVLGTTSGTRYDIAHVLDSIGGNIYVRVASTGDFKLKWRDSVGSAATVFARHAAINTAGSRSINSMSVTKDDQNILINPTQNLASPTSGTTYSGTSSAIIDLTVTAPSSLADHAGIRFRMQDSDNYWYAYFDSAGAFKVDRIIGGSVDGSSPYVNVAGVITTNATRRIRVRADGTTINFYTKSGTSWTQRGGNISDLLLQAYSDIVPVASTGWSIANLRSDPVYTAAVTTLLSTYLGIQ